MNMHHNARLTPKGRELLIERLERGVPPPRRRRLRNGGQPPNGLQVAEAVSGGRFARSTRPLIMPAQQPSPDA
jgi:hypothetical protein